MICIDANIVLDIILQRTNKSVCEDYLRQGNQEFAVTTLTVSLVMYFAEMKNIKLREVQGLLERFTWLSVASEDGEWAFKNYNDDDYEDAMQIGCAIRNKCDRFATLDKGLFKKYQNTLSVDLLNK